MIALLQGWRRRDRIAMALASFFLMVLAIEWIASGLFSARSNRDAATSEIPASSASVPMPALKDYTVMSERPLFIETRRPYVPTPSSLPAAAAAAPPEPLTLLATVLADGHRIALVQSQRDNRTQKVEVGAVLFGWTLAEVESDFVTLRRGNESRRLDLLVKPGNPTPAPVQQDEEEQ